MMNYQRNKIINKVDPIYFYMHPALLYEPRHEKTGFLHMRKQRRRSASR